MLLRETNKTEKQEVSKNQKKFQSNWKNAIFLVITLIKIAKKCLSFYKQNQDIKLIFNRNGIEGIL
jgi:Zn/Cd-binding protein ZinT